MRAQLASALNSLAGKERKMWDAFLGYSARYINYSAEGYIHLRQSGRVEASKLLIRPALEAMFRIEAVSANPSLLYRIARKEWTEDRKLVRPAAKRAGEDRDAEFDKAWADFPHIYAKEFPSHTLDETKFDTIDAARAAGVESFYDCAYRLYCQFTHGALRVASGGLRSTDELDSRTMAYCVFSALKAVESIGGDVPQLSSLRERLYSLTAEAEG